MSTVRISGYLKDTVKSNIDKIFEKRINKAKENYDTKWGQRIVDNLYPADLQTALNALHKDWFEVNHDLTLSSFYNMKLSEEYRYGLEFSNLFIKEYRRPHEYDVCKIEGVRFNYRNEVHLDANNPKWDWIKAEWIKYNEAIIELKKKRNEYQEKVMSILNAYKTLSPCLKVWQGLYDLLPEEIQDKHREVKEKRTVTKAEDLNIDTDSLSSTLITSKLTNNE
jgi:hypothetical protein